VASRYWVGGTGNWSNTAHWSTSSGGSSGASAPGSTDDVFFDGNSGSGVSTMDNGQTVNSLTASSYAGQLALAGDLVVSGTFSATGVSNAAPLYISSNGSGSIRKITAATVSLTNVILSDIKGAGAATWSGTRLADGGGNSAITFTTPVTLYWSADSGNLSDSTKWFLGSGGTGGAGRTPLVTDTCIFDANSFSGSGKTITNDMVFLPSLDFSAVTAGYTPTCSMTGALNLFGSTYNFTHASAGSGSGTKSFYNRGTVSFWSGGATWNGIINWAAACTLSLQDSCIFNNTMQVGFGGSLLTNGHNLTIGALSAQSGGGTIDFSTSTVTFPGSGMIWSFGAGTVHASNATIVVSDTTSATKEFSNSFSVGTLTWTGKGTLQFDSSMTIGTLNIAPSVAETLIQGAGTTLTVTTFNVNGASSGAHLTLKSSTNGTAWNLSVASGTVSCVFLSLQDSHAAGGASFYASQSTNTSGNTGWNFTQPPYAQTGAGGVVTGGAAALRSAVVQVGAGGVVTAGAAAFRRTTTQTGAGGVVAGGAAATTLDWGERTLCPVRRTEMFTAPVRRTVTGVVTVRRSLDVVAGIRRSVESIVKVTRS